MAATSTRHQRIRPQRSPAAEGGGHPGGRRPRRPPGLPWILPALVLSVGLLYYGIGYTGYISTLDWGGISPDARHVGGHNYTRILHAPDPWVAVNPAARFFAATFLV